MNEQLINKIIDEVMKRIECSEKIRIEASGRHVHLSEEDCMALFGTKELTPVRDLSQPGQYLCKEKVRLVGTKGIFQDVAVLGPCRKNTQVEISMTDARALGVTTQIRDSGDTNDVADIWIGVNEKLIHAKSSVIIPYRHLHMTPEDAKRFCLSDKDQVAVKVYGTRPLIFENVLVRVHKDFSLSMHIDYDEANAVGLTKTSYGEIFRLENNSNRTIESTDNIKELTNKIQRVVKELSIGSSLKKEETTKEEVAKEEKIVIKLVDEKKALAFAEKAYNLMIFDKKTIITPAAIDVFRARNIKWKKE